MMFGEGSIGRAARGALAGLTCVIAVAPAAARLPARARYVALGSSFASGPGITTSADAPPDRCTRSRDNYAHQLARARNLTLVDVSCGGATTEHVLSGWNELPPQVEALTADTRLVTITIGGNDLMYVGGLIAASCPPRTTTFGGALRCGSTPAATADQWAALDRRMAGIAREVKRRAPRATLVFVEYLRLLPDGEGCAATPVSAENAARARGIAQKLSTLTEAVAKRAGAKVLRTGFSQGHDACAAEPWVTGFAPSAAGAARVVPYHPNLSGMTAIAQALDRML